ncbi:MAG: fibrillarin-like rRNA/tRNA 2'-O-methyltransferase [Candidatus Hodarchaeales archaeon]
MELKQTYVEGLFRIKDRDKIKLATQNANEGVSVYGEERYTLEGKEYRIWDPYRSKFAAAFLSGMKSLPQIRSTTMLYLGVSTGTTASHFSDINTNGMIFGVEFSPKVMRRFFRLSEQRTNLVPILADARRPEEYSPFVFDVDLVYQDVAQPEQATIFGRNVEEFLKPGGYGVLAVKSQSIDVAIEPEKVFESQIKELEDDFGLKTVEYKSIDSFEKKHAVIVVKKI